MPQPKIQIPLTVTDQILEILSLFGLGLLIFLPFHYYDQLADIVPSHFGMDGKPDPWGGKNNIWLLPIIGTILYFTLTIVSRIPEKANYLVKITEQNAKQQYENALMTVRRLKLLIIGFLAYFMFWEIKIALGKAEGLEPLILWLFVAGMLFLIGAGFYRSKQIG